MRIPLRLAIGILAVLSLMIGWGVIDTSPAEALPGSIEVDIDIKPGSDPNSINCNKDNGVITVAILGSATFDVTQVDVSLVDFEGASAIHEGHETDIPIGGSGRDKKRGDGFTDLVLHFRLGDIGLSCSSTYGTLTGTLFDGTPFEGMDDVNMIGN